MAGKQLRTDGMSVLSATLSCRPVREATRVANDDFLIYASRAPMLAEVSSQGQWSSAHLPDDIDAESQFEGL